MKVVVVIVVVVVQVGVVGAIIEVHIANQTWTRETNVED